MWKMYSLIYWLQLFEPQIPFDRFSDFNKLCKATTFKFKFINKCKCIRDSSDPKQFAKRYLIKIMQLYAFNKDIVYFLRDDCRIANARRYEYN